MATNKIVRADMFEKIIKSIIGVDRRIVLLDNNTPKDVTEDMVIAVDEGSKFGFYKPKKAMNGINRVDSVNFIPMNINTLLENTNTDKLLDEIKKIKYASNINLSQSPIRDMDRLEYLDDAGFAKLFNDYNEDIKKILEFIATADSGEGEGPSRSDENILDKYVMAKNELGITKYKDFIYHTSDNDAIESGLYCLNVSRHDRNGGIKNDNIWLKRNNRPGLFINRNYYEYDSRETYISDTINGYLGASLLLGKFKIYTPESKFYENGAHYSTVPVSTFTDIYKSQNENIPDVIKLMIPPTWKSVVLFGSEQSIGIADTISLDKIGYDPTVYDDSDGGSTTGKLEGNLALVRVTESSTGKARSVSKEVIDGIFASATDVKTFTEDFTKLENISKDDYTIDVLYMHPGKDNSIQYTEPVGVCKPISEIINVNTKDRIKDGDTYDAITVDLTDYIKESPEKDLHIYVAYKDYNNEWHTLYGEEYVYSRPTDSSLRVANSNNGGYGYGGDNNEIYTTTKKYVDLKALFAVNLENIKTNLTAYMDKLDTNNLIEYSTFSDNLTVLKLLKGIYTMALDNYRNSNMGGPGQDRYNVFTSKLSGEVEESILEYIRKCINTYIIGIVKGINNSNVNNDIYENVEEYIKDLRYILASDGGRYYYGSAISYTESLHTFLYPVDELQAKINYDFLISLFGNMLSSDSIGYDISIDQFYKSNENAKYSYSKLVGALESKDSNPDEYNRVRTEVITMCNNIYNYLKRKKNDYNDDKAKLDSDNYSSISVNSYGCTIINYPLLKIIADRMIAMFQITESDGLVKLED